MGAHSLVAPIVEDLPATRKTEDAAFIISVGETPSPLVEIDVEYPFSSLQGDDTCNRPITVSILLAGRADTPTSATISGPAALTGARQPYSTLPIDQATQPSNEARNRAWAQRISVARLTSLEKPAPVELLDDEAMIEGIEPPERVVETEFRASQNVEGRQELEICDGQAWNTRHGDRVAFRAPQIVVRSAAVATVIEGWDSSNGTVRGFGGFVDPGQLPRADPGLWGTSLARVSLTGFANWDGVQPGSSMDRAPVGPGSPGEAAVLVNGMTFGQTSAGFYAGTVDDAGRAWQIAEYELIDADLIDSTRAPASQSALLWSGVLLGLGAAALLELLLLLSRREHPLLDTSWARRGS